MKETALSDQCEHTTEHSFLKAEHTGASQRQHLCSSHTTTLMLVCCQGCHAARFHRPNTWDACDRLSLFWPCKGWSGLAEAWLSLRLRLHGVIEPSFPGEVPMAAPALHRATHATAGAAVLLGRALSAYCSNPGSVGLPARMLRASMSMSSMVVFRAEAAMRRARPRRGLGTDLG